WDSTLPIVLLGLRTALKTDIDCSPGEMLYGTTLRLPGEFFSNGPEDPAPDPTSYATKLKRIMRTIRPTPPRPQQRSAVYVSADLHSCTHVFLRRDAVRRPLQHPYDGPYRVITRGDKLFTIDINGRQETVSIDRLKPAY
ncbi:unnamed protein product, partial [Ixodes persulcatus]